MADFGAQISGFVKNEAQSFIEKNVNKISQNLSGLGGGIINSLIGSVTSGLSQNYFNIGAAFDTIEAIASQKLDSIVSGGAPEYSAGGKCIDRASAADISSLRNPSGGNLKSYLTDVFPETKIKDKYRENESYVLTTGSDKYYFQLRFYPYARTDLFKPAKSELKYKIILPLPMELFDAQRAEYNTPDLKTAGNLIHELSAGRNGDGVTVASVLNVTKSGLDTAIKAIKPVSDMVDIDAESISNIVEQYLGVTPNPNPAVAFKGPSLREFNFSWMFNPRNPEESRRIKLAIKKMKASTLPTTEFGSDIGLLRYPHVAMINFYPWDDENKVLAGEYGWGDESFIKIKRCVISNISSDFAPNGAPSFFAGSNDPTFIRLNMSFKEIEFFLSVDWGGEEGDGTYENLKNQANKFKDSIIETAQEQILNNLNRYGL